MSTPQTILPQLDFSAIDRYDATDVGPCRLYRAGTTPAAGPPLLFVPGAYHGAWCYSHYLGYFAQHGLESFAIDLPGHGARHAGMRPDLGIADLAESLVAGCRHIARRVILVGHSMGALPVLLAASEIDAAAIILLAPSPPGNLPGAQMVPPVPAGGLRPPPEAAEVRSRFAGLAPQAPVDALCARLNAESARILNERYQLSVHVDPERIACPGVCFEAGQDDADRHPPGQDEAIARFLGFEHHVLAHQPHCMMYAEHWQESASALLDWHGSLFGQTAGPMSFDQETRK